MSKGGRREGAGRPNTGRTTKVVRIPQDLALNEILELREKLKTWEELAQGKTGSRWEKVHELLRDCLKSE